ncbi:MAG: gliding motility protein RemB [Flavobacteriaceae bacterium]|nr:gliding motility protein RemB [Flavobacteriaceae bacterium]
MSKKNILFLFLYFSFAINLFAQEEKYPVYSGCAQTSEKNLQQCFLESVKKEVLNKIELPETLKKDNFEGTINILFLVNREGRFEMLYADTNYGDLKKILKHVFKNIPTAKPALYGDRPVEMRFIFPLTIPLGSAPKNTHIAKDKPKQLFFRKIKRPKTPKKIKLRFVKKAITQKGFYPEHQSVLNIPLSQSDYTFLDYYYNKNSAAHTDFKPFIYDDATKYVDLDAQKNALLKLRNSWFGRKFWNEHMLIVQDKDYWFTLNPIADLQLGKDNSGVSYTYNNTRAVQLQGGLGSHLNFSSTIYESQGRFADYINQFIIDNKPVNSNGLVPGKGRSKEFNTNGYDYPTAEGYISYAPNQFFNFQFGHGKNFIGDGYRSLFLSDTPSASPYIKIATTFWKIRYTNLWLFMDDVRPEAQINGANARKFVVMHNLSYNINKKLTISLFESVISDNASHDGLNINYINPIIFFRPIEFSRGESAGNALLGLGLKYKFTDNFLVYNQILVDELNLGNLTSGVGSWTNKFGFQIGAKYFNAFKIENLHLQTELNIVRPFTYSHANPILNYAHFNQPIAHPWGANFWEFIAIARYKKDRWFGNAKFIIGKKGFDIEGNNTSFGGDLYIDYNQRGSDVGQTLAQGNKTAIFIGDLQAGYLINPATNLKLFANISYRKFTPTITTTHFKATTTTWINFGFRTDLFNWYFDF